MPGVGQLDRLFDEFVQFRGIGLHLFTGAHAACQHGNFAGAVADALQPLEDGEGYLRAFL
jgi:hypothetical protein